MDVNRSSFKAVVSCVYVALVLWSSVCGISVTAPAELSAVRGAAVTLSCSFSSSSRVTSLMSVDWTFQPESGGPAKLFFHFASQAYPPEEGHFKGRVQWKGRPSLGDASVQLLNASLTDNGTYTCTVRNPPDFQGSPGQTVLRVTPQRLALAFTDVGVLLVLVLGPSALVTLLLLGRMMCCCQSPAQSHHSPIEVLPGEEQLYGQVEQKPSSCCCYFKGSEYDDDYDYMHEKQHELSYSEAQC